MDETTPQLLRLLSEYNTKGATVSYCSICFRSEKDRLMVTPVYIYKVLGALKLAIYTAKKSNIKVCSVCEALAKRAFTIHQLINLAVLVNRLTARLSRGSTGSENLFENIPPSMHTEIKQYDNHLEKIRKITAFTTTNILCVSSKINSNEIIVVDEDDDEPKPSEGNSNMPVANLNPQVTMPGYQPQQDVFILPGPDPAPQNNFIPILLAPFNITSTDGMITLVPNMVNQPPAIINIPPLNNAPAICSEPLPINNPSTNNMSTQTANSTKKTTNARKLPNKQSTSESNIQQNISKKSANDSLTGYNSGSTYAVDRITVTKLNDVPTKRKKVQDTNLEPVRVFAGDVPKKADDRTIYGIGDQTNMPGLSKPADRLGLSDNRHGLNGTQSFIDAESHKNLQTDDFNSNNWADEAKVPYNLRKESNTSKAKRLGQVVVGDWLGEQVIKSAVTGFNDTNRHGLNDTYIPFTNVESPKSTQTEDCYSNNRLGHMVVGDWLGEQVVKSPAVKEGRIDWEDKIPMDVISFVDKQSSTLLVPQQPTPMGCISQVTSLREPHNYNSIQVIDLCE